MRRRHSHPRERLIGLLIVALAAGCGGSPAPADLARSALSWRATSQLVVDRWEHDAVSRRFATLTLDRAESQLQSLQQQASQLSDSVKTRRALVEFVAATRRAVTDADSATQRGDRPGAGEAMQRIDATDSAGVALVRAAAHQAR